MTTPELSVTARTRYVVLADAIAALTEAARLSWFHTDDDGETTTELVDWAEMVALALAGAAANIGSIEKALAGRPGSCAAGHIRNLLISTFGDDGELLRHRTEPLVVTVHVDEVLSALGTWAAYDQAEKELDGRYDAIGIPTATTPETGALLAPATPEQERQAEQLAELGQRLEQQRKHDWEQYGQAVAANARAIAGRLPGLRVPVVVNVDLVNSTPARREQEYRGVAERVRDQAVRATAPPGGGRTPLERLL